MSTIPVAVDRHCLLQQRQHPLCSPPRPCAKHSWHGHAARSGQPRYGSLHVCCAELATGAGGDATLSFLRDPLAFLTEKQRSHADGVARITLAGQPVLLVWNPSLARAVFEGDDSFQKDGTAFLPNSSLAGNGLLVSDGEVWRSQRQLSNPAFRRAAVAGYGAAMAAGAARLVEEWKARRHSGTVDVFRDYNELTLRITTTVLFGDDLDAARASQLVQAVARAFEYFARRSATGFVIPEWLPTPDNLQFRQSVQTLDAVVYDIISRRRTALAAARQHDEQMEGCLLDALMLSEDEEGRRMSDAGIRDELMTLLIAGQETSAILLGWCTAFLAHEPEVLTRSLQEVDSVFPDSHIQPSVATVSSLPYLEAVILETLRLRPPAYIVGRCASRDVQLASSQPGGCVDRVRVPAGSTVLISPYLMHRDAAAWPEPQRFWPERWLDASVHDSAASRRKDGAASRGGGLHSALVDMGPNGAFVPFGAGRRNCIGTGFAMQEALLVLATVLQQFRLEAAGPFPRAAPNITLRPADICIQLQERRR